MNRDLINISNADTICDYVIAMNAEANISLPSTRRNILINLTSLLKWCCTEYYKTPSVLFKDITSNAIKRYLDSIEKSEEEDPTHKWIGSYNFVSAAIQKFYRWLYFPNTRSDERPLPDQVSGLKKIRRKEMARYTPTDLWSMAEHAIFLKHCPSARIKVCHAMALDTSARRHELLKLKIKDLKERPIPAVKDPVTGKVARQECVIFQFTVNGKTGTRTLALTNSMPYVKQWLEEHPQRGNKEAFLFVGYDRSKGKAIRPDILLKIYTIQHRKEVFPKLLQDPNVPQEDKDVIKIMLEERKWNAYVIRHSSLTMKAKERLISDQMLRQHTGWSKMSNMPSVYIHQFGNESVDELLKSQGYLPREDNTFDFNPLGIKKCGNCGTKNLPEAISCSHCKLLIDSVAFNEIMKEQEAKELELVALKNKMDAIEKGLTERNIFLDSWLKNPKAMMETIVKEIVRNRPITTGEQQQDQEQEYQQQQQANLLEGPEMDIANVNWLEKQVNTALESANKDNKLKRE